MIRSHSDGRRNQEVVTNIPDLVFDASFLISTIRITALNLETIVRNELLEGVRINGFFPCRPYFSDG